MRRGLALVVLTLLVSAMLAGRAEAASGPCLGAAGGPTCQFWTGAVVDVNDGDTLDVDIDGDGTRRAFTVRVTGVQAMEQTRYSRRAERRRGACHAVEATARVERLIRAGRGRVRLSAEHASSRYGGRLARSVAVRIGGRWRDVGSVLMREGHALWMPDEIETAWNARYNALGQEAARRGAGLWNPTHCGAGPSQDVPLRVWVNWDPPGIDRDNLNGEWVKVRNLSATKPVDLGGWWLRDSLLGRFTFPAGTVLLPGRTLTVHDGSGPRTADTFHWGLREAIFQNTGDGAYLFDPKGDLRASFVYPCVVACADPNQGALSVTARPRRPEGAVVRNVSDRAVDLYGYALNMSGAYPFAPGTVLRPGASIDVHVSGDRPMLRDAGGSVTISTFDGIRLACDAWGDGSC